MKFRSVAAKLLVFTAFTGAVTILLASNIGNFSFFKSRYTVSAVFDDVTGLLNNDPVTLAGDSSQLDRTLVNLNTATGELGRLIKDNRASLERDLDDLVTLLELVLRHQGDLKQITTHLDDILAATLRVMSFGEWANLYVPALCISSMDDCENASASSVSNEPRGFGSLLTVAGGAP